LVVEKFLHKKMKRKNETTTNKNSKKLKTSLKKEENKKEEISEEKKDNLKDESSSDEKSSPNDEKSSSNEKEDNSKDESSSDEKSSSNDEKSSSDEKKDSEKTEKKEITEEITENKNIKNIIVDKTLFSGIHVGGVPYYPKVDELKKEFSKIGEIKEIILPICDGGKYLGVCFIEYEKTFKIEDHKDLFEKTIIFDKRRLKIQPTTKIIVNKDHENKLKTRAFIIGLPYEITNEEFVKVFKVCGEIASYIIPRFPDTGKITGTSIIQFKNEESVNRLKILCYDKKINERKIHFHNCDVQF
jgi:RNA recognition motif-containing protein